jgi:hypothetical protein
MHTVTIAVDLAKNVFELAIATRPGSSPKRRRLSRPQFETFWVRRSRVASLWRRAPVPITGHAI